MIHVCIHPFGPPDSELAGKTFGLSNRPLSDQARSGCRYLRPTLPPPPLSTGVSNFTDYDRRSKLFVSVEAPTADGYLASSGDGANARCVGLIALNSSRQLDNELCVASLYNSENLVKKADGSGSSWDAITLATSTTVTGCSFNFVVPKGWTYQTGGVASFRNEDTDVADFELDIRDDTTVLGDTYNRAANGANYASEIQMALSTSKYATAASVVKLNLAVTATGTGSTPTVRPDYAYLHVVRIPV